jgi:hypothetical protein
MEHNGLGWHFENVYDKEGDLTDVKFVVKVSTGRDFTSVPELDFHSWLEKVKK